MQLGDLDAVLGVLPHVTGQILGVGLEVFRGLHEPAVVVGLRALHPGGRGPRAGEQLHVRLPFLGTVDVRDERLLVAFHGEVLHVVVAVDLVIAVPVVGEVVGAHGRAVEREVHLLGIEELLDDLVAFRLGDGLQRQPAEFVEAAAETAQRLVFVAVELQIRCGGCASGSYLTRTIDEPIVLSGGNPCGHGEPLIMFSIGWSSVLPSQQTTSLYTAHSSGEANAIRTGLQRLNRPRHGMRTSCDTGHIAIDNNRRTVMVLIMLPDNTRNTEFRRIDI